MEQLNCDLLDRAERKNNNPIIKCHVCHHGCELIHGQTGKCGIRINNGNKVTIGKFYGHCSTIALDSIEKRPFFHFTPGHDYLSVGLFGCNFFCSECANYEVSQNFDRNTIPLNSYYSPKSLIDFAKKQNASGIVFTYNEPTIHYEFIREVGLNAVYSDLHLAIKTNGFASLYVIRDLGFIFDAFNIDIKGNELDYEELCGGYFRPVRRAIEKLVRMGSWVEISYLVTPRTVDDMNFHKEKAKWLSSLNRKIPVHILFLYPFHRIKEQYKEEKLIPIYEIMKSYLEHVYISNVYDSKFDEYRNTKCSKCGRTLISRNKKTIIHDVECCGQKITGISMKKTV